MINLRLKTPVTTLSNATISYMLSDAHVLYSFHMCICHILYIKKHPISYYHLPSSSLHYLPHHHDHHLLTHIIPRLNPHLLRPQKNPRLPLPSRLLSRKSSSSSSSKALVIHQVIWIFVFLLFYRFGYLFYNFSY